jgi:hypothetical protein
MPPLTLSVFAALLRMQGSELEIYSDNPGVEQLLAQVREQFNEQSSPRASSSEKLAAYAKANYIRFIPYAKINPTTPAGSTKTLTSPSTPTGPSRGAGRK